MRYLTRIEISSKRLKSGATVELYRHVVELDNCKSVTVDDDLNYYELVEREYEGVTIDPDYAVSSSSKHFATILLAVELVKFIDEEINNRLMEKPE